MILKCLIRYSKELLLKALKISCICYRFHCFRILEDEWPEGKVLDNEISKFERE